MSRGYSLVAVRGLLTEEASLVAEDGLLTEEASLVAEHGLWSSQASVVVAHRLSCPKACGSFLDQGSNPCPLHWLADS